MKTTAGVPRLSQTNIGELLPVQLHRRSDANTSPDRALSIIDLFSPDRSSWTVEEAARELNLSESTAYRYFRSLSASGLIFSVRPGQYLLGPGIIQYERRLRISDPLSRHARPVLRDLAAQYSMPGVVFISRIFREHVMSMFEAQLSKIPMDISYDRGRLMPLFAGAPALAILAYTPIRTVQRMFTLRSERGAPRNDIDVWLQLKRQMRRIRQVGYSIDRSQIDPGISYISVALGGQNNDIVGSLTLATEAAVATETFCEEAVARLHSADRVIASAMAAELAAEDARLGRPP